MDKEINKLIKEYSKTQEINKLALLIDQAGKHKKLEMFLKVQKDIQSRVILYMSEYSREYIVRKLPKKKLLYIIKEMHTDDSVDILGYLPEKVLLGVLKEVSFRERIKIERLLEYAKDTAGGIMDADVATMEENLTVDEAMERVRELKKTFSRIYNVFVTDKKGVLKGVISVCELIAANRKKRLKDVMRKKIFYAFPNHDKEKVERIFLEHKIASLPVVNKNKIVIGRILFDDIMHVIEEETSEDFMNAMGGDSEIGIFDPVKKNIKKRLPWLILNLFTALIAANTVSLFEKTIQQVVILAVFMPIVAGMGGNAGSQCLAIKIRAISQNRLHFGNAFKVWLNEIGTDLSNAVIVGLLMGIIAFLWKGNMLIGMIIFMAMIINIFIAGTVGTFVPLLLQKMNIDPAVGSGVLVTMFTDSVGFFSFLGIATLMLHWLV